MLAIAEGSVLHDAQGVFQHLLGFTLPLFWGRMTMGFIPSVMPKRAKIHIVVGPKIRNSRRPSSDSQLTLDAAEAVDALHAEYLASLRRLYLVHQHLWQNRSKSGALNII